MPTYVDGFVIPVPTRKLADYRRLALRMGKLWIRARRAGRARMRGG